MSDNGLKPCPFCGGEAEIERYGTQRQSCIIVCDDCGCRLEVNETFSCGDSWNNRPELKAQLQKARAEGIREAAKFVREHAQEAGLPTEAAFGIGAMLGYADQLEKEE